MIRGENNGSFSGYEKLSTLLPYLKHMEVSDIVFSASDNSCLLEIVLLDFPDALETAFKNENALKVSLLIRNMISFLLDKFSRNGYSSLSIIDTNAEFCIKITGAVNFNAVSSSISVVSIYPYINDRRNSQ